MHHHEVAIENARIDHRVAANAQHEQVAVAGEVGGHWQELFDVLLGQHIGACGNIAHEWDVAHGAALHSDA